MILRATIRPDPDTGERRELEVVCASFEQGRADITAQTPTGWRRTHLVTVAST